MCAWVRITVVYFVFEVLSFHSVVNLFILNVVRGSRKPVFASQHRHRLKCHETCDYFLFLSGNWILTSFVMYEFVCLFFGRVTSPRRKNTITTTGNGQMGNSRFALAIAARRKKTLISFPHILKGNESICGDQCVVAA